MTEVTLIGSSAGLALAFVVLAAAAVVITVPRWLIRPLVRDSMWKMRDEFVDRVIAGELPSSEPTVVHFRHRLDIALAPESEVTMAKLVGFMTAADRVPGGWRAVEERRQVVAEPTNENVRRIVAEYEARYANRVALLAVFGSWFGMLVTALVVPAYLIHRRRLREESPIEFTERQSTRYLKAYESEVYDDRFVVIAS